MLETSGSNKEKFGEVGLLIVGLGLLSKIIRSQGLLGLVGTTQSTCSSNNYTRYATYIMGLSPQLLSLSTESGDGWVGSGWWVGGLLQRLNYFPAHKAHN